MNSRDKEEIDVAELMAAAAKRLGKSAVERERVLRAAGLLRTQRVMAKKQLVTVRYTKKKRP